MMPTRQRDSIREMEEVYDEMQGVYDRMGQLMQGVFGTLAPTSIMSRLPSAWRMPADIEETDDAIIVELELPGVRSEDVDVELRGNHLLVSGEIKERERRGVLRRQTRNLGRFEHVVLLPCDINPDKVEASLADGVMTIRMAKAVTEKGHHIPVKSG
ncbi:MAG: Hsp20/alpha crystallin family protein [Actinomadura sp.]